MTPSYWNAVLAPDVNWRTAYAEISREARNFLAGRAEQFSTTELVDRLYPEAAARGEGITARNRIFAGLAASATRSLADCATRGPEVKRMGRKVRPWVWHAPGDPNPESLATAKVCPHCGGML